MSSSTKYTPFELVFGRETKLSHQNIDKSPTLYNNDDYVSNLKYNLQQMAFNARQHAIQAKEQREIRYDKNARDRKFEPGDMIKLKGLKLT